MSQKMRRNRYPGKHVPGWPGRAGSGRAGPGRVAQISLVIDVFPLGIPILPKHFFSTCTIIKSRASRGNNNNNNNNNNEIILNDNSNNRKN